MGNTEKERKNKRKKRFSDGGSGSPRLKKIFESARSHFLREAENDWKMTFFQSAI
jgi:hypothetical protein